MREGRIVAELDRNAGDAEAVVAASVRVARAPTCSSGWASPRSPVSSSHSRLHGRKVYAAGNNPTAAFLAGVNVKLVTVSLYALSGMFAALAGIVLVSYSGQPTLGIGGVSVPLPVDRRSGDRRDLHPRRAQQLPGDRGRRHGLVALVGLLQAENMPEYGRSIVYGVAILVVLVLFGLEERV